jgi:hypothetical protein
MLYYRAMFATLLLFCSLALAETKTLAVQICLDRAGFSANVLDGQWGRRSQSALEKYCAYNCKSLPLIEKLYDMISIGSSIVSLVEYCEDASGKAIRV